LEKTMTGLKLVGAFALLLAAGLGEATKCADGWLSVISLPPDALRGLFRIQLLKTHLLGAK